MIKNKPEFQAAENLDELYSSYDGGDDEETILDFWEAKLLDYSF